jgi:ABC-type sugar transport system ATPase subunit
MVKLNNIVKSFDGEIDAAVKGISLDIKEGEFLTNHWNHWDIY